mmetsp:Transcript_26821/g.78392  ORF Transcript_26821/g.78392 Transcript_26821/m.78392 type:complete len:311 (-) Transcript_26821:78-1010(-)
MRCWFLLQRCIIRRTHERWRWLRRWLMRHRLVRVWLVSGPHGLIRRRITFPLGDCLIVLLPLGERSLDTRRLPFSSLLILHLHAQPIRLTDGIGVFLDQAIPLALQHEGQSGVSCERYQQYGDRWQGNIHREADQPQVLLRLPALGFGDLVCAGRIQRVDAVKVVLPHTHTLRRLRERRHKRVVCRARVVHHHVCPRIHARPTAAGDTRRHGGGGLARQGVGAVVSSAPVQRELQVEAVLRRLVRVVQPERMAHLVRRGSLKVKALPTGQEDLIPEYGGQHEHDSAERDDAARKVGDGLEILIPLGGRLL